MAQEFLSPEKQNALNAFISKAVMVNASFEYTSSFGKTEPQTVQQLVHTNTTTLKKIGMQLEKVVSNSGNSRFNKDKRMQIPANSGLYAEEWLDFIELCLERQETIRDERKNQQELEEINAQLENLETPDEKKTKLLQRKLALTGGGNTIPLPITPSAVS